MLVWTNSILDDILRIHVNENKILFFFKKKLSSRSRLLIPFCIIVQNYIKHFFRKLIKSFRGLG